MFNLIGERDLSLSYPSPASYPSEEVYGLVASGPTALCEAKGGDLCLTC